jgi:hypothetical protein
MSNYYISNYYISKCCDWQVYQIYGKTDYICGKCHHLCEVTAMINSPGGVPKVDKSVKAYQEDIKAEVDVSGDEFRELKASELFY